MKKRVKSNQITKFDNRFVISKFQNFAAVEAYNSARTNLMFSLSTKKKKAVVITSNFPNEGKSSTSINLSITFAKTGAKVLLIDADLRKPSIQTIFGIKNSRGFSSLIGNFCSFDEAINRNVEENLDVLCSGPVPPNPAELLTSAHVAELLAFFHRKYDYIFIDTPPIGVVSDALLLNYLVAGIVFVVRENSTTHNDIKQSLRAIELAKGNLLGFIKVDCKVNVGIFDKRYKHGRKYKKYGYDYDYGYGYGYGGSYKAKSKEKDSIQQNKIKRSDESDLLSLDNFDIGDLNDNLDLKLKDNSTEKLLDELKSSNKSENFFDDM